MAKVILQGKIVEVIPTVAVGANGLLKQIIRIMVFPEKDDFGDAIGDTEVWELAVLGDKIERLGITTQSEGKIGTAKVFLNSNTVKSKDGTDMYIINALLHRFEVKA